MSIYKVQLNKGNGQKFVNIAKADMIEGGDWVELRIIRRCKGEKSNFPEVKENVVI